MSCYIHGDGTFDLKIHDVVVWGGGNLYNLDEIEREIIFYKTMKKKLFPTYSVLEKSAYHLIVAIFVELPICRCFLKVSTLCNSDFFLKDEICWN